MDRRRFLLTSLAGVVSAPLAAEAQPAGRIWRIGYVSLVSEKLEQYRPWVAAFRDGLRELGYVEGENVVIEQRYAAGHVERLPALAAELVRLKVDILVAAPSGSALSAKESHEHDPDRVHGRTRPRRHRTRGQPGPPGGNVTGLADAHADLIAKRLGLLKEVVPSASRVLLWTPSNASTAPQLKMVQAAAPALGLTVVPVRSKDRTWRSGPGLRSDREERPGGLLVIADPTLGNQRTRIAELSIAHRLPRRHPPRMAEGGLLMSYGTDFVELFRHGAVLVDKILKGAKPATLPVEQPTKFELAINLKTAKALGLTIPPSLLARADRVIE